MARSNYYRLRLCLIAQAIHHRRKRPLCVKIVIQKWGSLFKIKTTTRAARCSNHSKNRATRSSSAIRSQAHSSKDRNKSARLALYASSKHLYRLRTTICPETMESMAHKLWWQPVLEQHQRRLQALLDRKPQQPWVTTVVHKFKVAHQRLVVATQISHAWFKSRWPARIMVAQAPSIIKSRWNSADLVRKLQVI